MTKLNFAALRRANKDRQAEWPGGEKVTMAFRTLELMGEVGELINLVKKGYRLEEGISGTNESKNQLQLMLADELADVAICLDLTCMTGETPPLRFLELDNFSAGYIAKTGSIVLLGNLLAARTGKIAEMSFNRDYDNHVVHMLCCEALVAVHMIAEYVGVNLDLAVPMKFNATSAKHGLKTRML